MAKDKEDKPASTRAQAVTGFTVPVTAAWLLAVGGILSWGMPVEGLLENAGKIAAAVGGGVAFLTVVLSAVQDIVPLQLKTRTLFFKGEKSLPSYRAFSGGLMATEKLDFVTDLETAKADAESQNKRWSEYYDKYRDHQAVAPFSARHVAWRETAVVLVLLVLISTVFVIAVMFGWLMHLCLWAWLLVACLILLAMSVVAGRNSSDALVIAVLERVRIDDETPKAEARPAPGG